MNKVKVVFDMDDVLVSLIDSWTDEINKRFHENVKVEDITDWDMGLAYPRVSKTLMFNILKEQSFWDRVKPCAHAVDYLSRFSKEYEIYIATAAHTQTIEAKINRCLYKYFPFLTEDHIIMIRNKSLLDCDYIIDDNPDNLRYSNATAILIDRPWNRNCDELSYEYRVRDLKEAYEVIQKCEKERTGKIW